MGSAYETRFIANGALLAATGETGILRTRAIDGASVKADLCGRIGDPLTAEESARYLPGITRTGGCAK